VDNFVEWSLQLRSCGDSGYRLCVHSYSMRPRLPGFLHSANVFLSANPLWTLVLGGVVGAFFSVILGLFFPQLIGRVQRQLRRRLKLDPLDYLMMGEGSMYISVATTAPRSFARLGTKRTVTLPENAPFLPFGQAMGMADLRAAVNDRFGKSRTVNIDYAHRFGGAWEHSFIALGGPYVHPVVKEVLDKGLVPGFTIEEEPSSNEPIVNDEGQIFRAHRDQTEARNANARLISDIGVIIWMRSPYNPDLRLCILFGLWPPGTFAAVDAFLQKSVGDKKQQHEFTHFVRSGQNCVAIVEANISALTIGRPAIKKVRSFKNPQESSLAATPEEPQ
jgi:hypothetical protein